MRDSCAHAVEEYLSIEGRHDHAVKGNQKHFQEKYLKLHLLSL